MFRPSALQRCLIALLCISFIVTMIISISVVADTGLFGFLNNKGPSHNEGMKRTEPGRPSLLQKLSHVVVTDNKKDADAEDGREESDNDQDGLPKPNYSVHVFYYPWYGNEDTDKDYYHWNHRYLPHWDKKEAARWPAGRHIPPGDIGASFYPSLGAYSSRDPQVLDDHMRQIKASGAGVLSVSWYPPEQADDEGRPPDEVMPQILDYAQKYKLKVCFHIEPFKGRDQATLRDNIKYILGKYGEHPAFYRHKHKGKYLPLYYIYDSYLVNSKEWAQLFQTEGAMTVRGTNLDGIFIGLLVQPKHQQELLSAGFDGFYTYFASDGFTFGSSRKNWPPLAQYARSHGLLFVPSIGPGYDDERIRPWNARSTKPRDNGRYYEDSFQAALLTNPAIVTVTSFNEWGEGTQIEKAIPKTIPKHTYRDYSPHEPDYYLSLTRKWIFKFNRRNRH